MKCPFCKSVLIKSINRKYETLLEHACDPNMIDYPLRPSWECPSKCEMSLNSFWDEQGGWYAGHVNYRTLRAWRQKNGHSTAAIGSWERWQNNKTRFANKIRPYLFWYKHDISYRIANSVFRLFKPPYKQDEDNNIVDYKNVYE